MSISPLAAVLLTSGGGAASRGSLAAGGLYKALTSNLNDSQTYPTFPPLLAFSISRDKGDGASNERRLLGTVRSSVSIETGRGGLGHRDSLGGQGFTSVVLTL